MPTDHQKSIFRSLSGWEGTVAIPVTPLFTRSAKEGFVIQTGSLSNLAPTCPLLALGHLPKRQIPPWQCLFFWVLSLPSTAHPSHQILQPLEIKPQADVISQVKLLPTGCSGEHREVQKKKKLKIIVQVGKLLPSTIKQTVHKEIELAPSIGMGEFIHTGWVSNGAAAGQRQRRLQSLLEYMTMVI